MAKNNYIATLNAQVYCIISADMMIIRKCVLSSKQISVNKIDVFKKKLI